MKLFNTCSIEYGNIAPEFKKVLIDNVEVSKIIIKIKNDSGKSFAELIASPCTIIGKFIEFGQINYIYSNDKSIENCVPYLQEFRFINGILPKLDK